MTGFPDQVPVLKLSSVILPGLPSRIEIKCQTMKNMILDLLDKNMQQDSAFIGIIPTVENEKITPGRVGTLALISQILSQCQNSQRRKLFVTMTGVARFTVKNVLNGTAYPTVRINVHKDHLNKVSQERQFLRMVEELKGTLINLLHVLELRQLHYILSSKKSLTDISMSLLLDICADIALTDDSDKLVVLETLDFQERLRKTLPLIQKFVKDGSSMNGQNDTETTVFGVIPQPVRNKPLVLPTGANGNLESDFKTKIENAKMPPEVKKVAENELDHLNKISPFSAEHSVVRNYLETLISLPWSVSSFKQINIEEAKEGLDKDHYSMDKVKRRVLEYLAVKQLKGSNVPGPILCFVGPPGVGKTSIGQSIANIMGRKFQRVSLGGVSNPSDIRGHRKTYVGAMPGRVIQAIKTAGTNNPVILLDEVDKMGRHGVHGDVTAALLEVLDPEQNRQFVDHYINVPFDLSQVVFIATANTMDTVPPALSDRLEVIPVSGYSQDEKVQILRKYILPKQMDRHGIDESWLEIPDDTLRLLISGYTRETGVREMERKVAALCRHTALKVACESKDKMPLVTIIDSQSLVDILGQPIYGPDLLERWDMNLPGVVVGLSYTPYGGQVLIVEATKLDKGTGKLTLTGKLGSVLSESATIALNWVRAAVHQYGIVNANTDILTDTDVHIHMPEGAVGKEGPSAGVTIAVALLSLFSGLPVAPSLAMTGELTLQGNILPVGGIKEKLMAAHSAHIKRVLLPKESISKIDEIPTHVLDSMELVFVSHMTEVVEAAFGGQLIAKNMLSSKL